MASENELIVQAESARLERAKIEERMAISADLANVEVTPDGLVCRDGRALRRMAMFFADSSIWPEAFQGKPANCFVALTLAAKLKCDPTMLACNLFETKGKWGMQSKLTTALAAAAGVFRGEIWHTFSGEGENYTCTAHAIMAVSGSEVTQSLSRREARAWGWYEPKGEKKLPSKWVQMEEGMFKYRTSDWLIRHYAPQVTMGLLSADEVEEIASGVPEPPRKTAPKKDALPAPAAEQAPTAEPRDDSALGLVGVKKSAALGKWATPEPWLSLINSSTTKEQIKTCWKSIDKKYHEAIGPEGIKIIWDRCLARGKELSNGNEAAAKKTAGVAPGAGSGAPPHVGDAAEQAEAPKAKRGRPRKATDAEIESEQAKFDAELRAKHKAEQAAAAPRSELEPSGETPKDSEAGDKLEPLSVIDDANLYLPEQWTNRDVDKCVETILAAHPEATEHDRKTIETLAGNRKRRIAS